MVLQLASGRFRVGVIPGRVLSFEALYLQRIVACLAFRRIRGGS
jgi:hypothetical protein